MIGGNYKRIASHDLLRPIRENGHPQTINAILQQGFRLYPANLEIKALSTTLTTLEKNSTDIIKDEIDAYRLIETTARAMEPTTEIFAESLNSTFGLVTDAIHDILPKEILGIKPSPKVCGNITFDISNLTLFINYLVDPGYDEYHNYKKEPSNLLNQYIKESFKIINEKLSKNPELLNEIMRILTNTYKNKYLPAKANMQYDIQGGKILVRIKGIHLSRHDFYFCKYYMYGDPLFEQELGEL